MAAAVLASLTVGGCSRTHGNSAGSAAVGGIGGAGGAGGTDAAIGASRICPLAGRFAAVNPDGSCPPVYELSKYSPNNNLVFFLGIYADGSNASVPKCQDMSAYDGGFRFRLRVDQVKLGSHVVDNGQQAQTAFDSAILGADLDADPVCGMGVFLNSVSEQVSLASGRTLFAAQRTVVRSDSDQPGGYILYDENRQVLYAYLASVRIDTFAGDLGDLFPGLSIAASSDVICRVPDADMSLVTARLSTGSDVCDVDSHSERCCKLWGRTYEVQMVAALGPSGSRPYSTVTFTLRTPGFFVKAQP